MILLNKTEKEVALTVSGGTIVSNNNVKPQEYFEFNPGGPPPYQVSNPQAGGGSCKLASDLVEVWPDAEHGSRLSIFTKQS